MLVYYTHGPEGLATLEPKLEPKLEPEELALEELAPT